MSKYKRLFIDKISEDFDQKKDLVLGPWCLDKFYSLNEIKKLGESGVYLENKSIDHTKAFKCCEIQHKKLINKISSYVREINKNQFSAEFYSNYISTWFTSFVHLLHYSERIIELYIKKYEKEEIEIILFNKPEKIYFKNSQDFILKCVNRQDFFSNFVLFLLLKKKPQKWKQTYLNNNNSKINEDINKDIIKKIYFKIIKLTSNILAPRIKSVYGFNIFERFFLSLLLFFKKKINFENESINYYSKIKENETYSNPPISDDDIIKLAKELLPDSYKSIYKKKKYFFNTFGKIILCSGPSLLYDDSDRYDLLLFKEKKGNIYSVQHGGNYGELFLQRGSVELAVDKFISWGQKKHENYNINFEPLPSPQLKKNYKKNSSKNILFVSTAHFYSYPRYVSCQSFQDSIDRINDSVSFLNELNDDIIKRIKYKTHTSQISEKDILNTKFKNLNFLENSPEKEINNSKIIVLNHYSTLLFKSLAANAPTIFFCKKNCWKLTKKATEIFDILNKAGILFYDSKLAAKGLSKYLKNTEEWWMSNEVQNARKEFCDEFAVKKDNYLSIWAKYLWQTKG